MCHFMSAIVLKNGDLLCDPEHTDSHEDLLEANGIQDNGRGDFVRVEFTPPEDHEKDLDAWTFKVDQEDVPEWFTEKKESVILNLRDRVRRMIVDSNRSILLGGCWILVSGAVVSKVQNSRIYSMTGDAEIGGMFGSSQVHEMHDTSQVRRMYDFSQVRRMHNTSQVRRMYDFSQVRRMHNTSQVHDMHGTSRVYRMFDSSKVHEMHGTSQVHEMHGTSQVHGMHGTSQVYRMFGSSQVHEMHGTSQAPKDPVVGDYRNKPSEA